VEGFWFRPSLGCNRTHYECNRTHDLQGSLGYHRSHNCGHPVPVWRVPATDFGDVTSKWTGEEGSDVFRDRIDAGRQLAEELASYAKDPEVVVLGIPRGGVVVAAEVARRLDLPLDIVIASKIGAPQNPEYAVGAVSADGYVLPNPYAGFTESEVEHLGRDAREKVARRMDLYRSGREPVSVEGRTAIVIDDGIATGLTAEAAIAYLRRKKAKRIVLAVPVIASDSAERLEEMVDALVAVERPRVFYAVGQFYRHFDQTSDDEVISALRS